MKSPTKEALIAAMVHGERIKEGILADVRSTDDPLAGAIVGVVLIKAYCATYDGDLELVRRDDPHGRQGVHAQAAEQAMTDDEWMKMVDQVESRGPDISAFAGTFRGPVEACLALLLGAHACAEFVPGFDVLGAAKRLFDYLDKCEAKTRS